MLPDFQAVSALMRRIAAEEVLPRFRNLANGEIFEKSPGDVVTIADEKAEAVLKTELSALLPASRVIGEEAAAKSPDILNLLDDDGDIWIVDPIDGTQNFANGNTCFAMIVALVIDRETRAGWIFEPFQDRMIWAAKGQGAWENGNRLSISPRTDIAQFHGSLSKKLRKRLLKLHPGPDAPIPERMTRYACVGAEYADLARGQLQFARYMGNLKPWDHAAGILIHQEAGGVHGYADSKEAYIPKPPHRGRAILMAPSETAWRSLRDLTAGHPLGGDPCPR